MAEKEKHFAADVYITDQEQMESREQKKAATNGKVHVYPVPPQFESWPLPSSLYNKKWTEIHRKKTLLFSLTVDQMQYKNQIYCYLNNMGHSRGEFNIAKKKINI